MNRASGISCMKYFLLVSVIISLNSCNTAIGMWRDTKMGYRWSKQKVDNWRASRGGGGGGYESYDAPVY